MNHRANNRLALKLGVFVLAMFGFGYALVPLYDVFCAITGLNGKTNTTAISENSYQIDKNRQVTLQFVTSVNESAPLLFHAKTKQIKVHPGQYHTVNFYAQNQSTKPMLARAIPSVTPGAAAEYLHKTQCFCFDEQTFAIGQGKTMPVRFVIDPALPAKYQTITLAYTFFDNTNLASNQ